MDAFVDNLRFDLVPKLAVGARRGASIGRPTVARTPVAQTSSLDAVASLIAWPVRPSGSNVTCESGRSSRFRPGTQPGPQIFIGTGKPQHAEIVEPMADDL